MAHSHFRIFSLAFFFCTLQIAIAENVLVSPETSPAEKLFQKEPLADVAEPTAIDSVLKSQPELIELQTKKPTTTTTTTERPEKIVTVNSVPFFPPTTPSPPPLPENTTAPPPSIETTSSRPLEPLPEVPTPTITLPNSTTPLPPDTTHSGLLTSSQSFPQDSSKRVDEPAPSVSNVPEESPEPPVTQVQTLKESSLPLVPSDLPASSPEPSEETTTEGPIILRPPQKSTPGPIFIPAPQKLQVTCSVCGQENVFKYRFNEPHNCQRCGSALESSSKFSPPLLRYATRGRTNDVRQPFSQQKPRTEEKYFFPQPAVRTLLQPDLPKPQVAIRADVSLGAKDLLKMRENIARAELYKQSIGIPPVHYQTRESAAEPLQSQPHHAPAKSNQLKSVDPQPQAKWSWPIPSWFFASGTSDANKEGTTPEKTVRTAPEDAIVKTPAQNPVSAFFNCPLAKLQH